MAEFEQESPSSVAPLPTRSYPVYSLPNTFPYLYPYPLQAYPPPGQTESMVRSTTQNPLPYYPQPYPYYFSYQNMNSLPQPQSNPTDGPTKPSVVSPSKGEDEVEVQVEQEKPETTQQPSSNNESSNDDNHQPSSSV